MENVYDDYIAGSSPWQWGLSICYANLFDISLSVISQTMVLSISVVVHGYLWFQLLNWFWNFLTRR